MWPYEILRKSNPTSHKIPNFLRQRTIKQKNGLNLHPIENRKHKPLHESKDTKLFNWSFVANMFKKALKPKVFILVGTDISQR